MWLNFFHIAGITLPIALVVLIGMLSVRRGYFPSEGTPYLARFVTHVALPPALFLAVATQELETILNPGFFWAYGLGTVATVGVLVAWLFALKRSITHVGIAIFGGAVCNCMVVGLPISILVFEPIAVAAMGMVPFFQDIVIIPLALILADLGQGRDWRSSLKKSLLKTIKTPFIIAVVLGLGVAALPFDLPTQATRVLELLAAALAGVGLFMIGGALAYPKLGRVFIKITPVVLTKLILHPALVGLAFWLFPIANTELMLAGIFAASLPMIASYTAIGSAYGEAENAAVATLVATLASFITVAGLLTFLQ